MMDFKTARENMVHGQLLPNKIIAKNLLKQFVEVPREYFVDMSAKATSYADQTVKIGEGRAMYSPLLSAHLIQALAVEKGDLVLVIGGGTGYSAALLAPLAEKIHMLEENQALVDVARKMLNDLKVENITLEKGILPQKLAAESFHKILLDVPAEEIPTELFASLKKGGKLAAVVSGQDGLMEAAVFTKNSKTMVQEVLFETAPFAASHAFKTKEKFVF